MVRKVHVNITLDAVDWAKFSKKVPNASAVINAWIAVYLQGVEADLPKMRQCSRCLARFAANRKDCPACGMEILSAPTA